MNHAIECGLPEDSEYINPFERRKVISRSVVIITSIIRLTMMNNEIISVLAIEMIMSRDEFQKFPARCLLKVVDLTYETKLRTILLWTTVVRVLLRP
jgi:hypothetical protein